MHDIRWIREHPDEFDRALARRGPQEITARDLLVLDEARRGAIQRFEAAQARRNAASKEIGEAKKAKDEARAGALLAEVAQLKTSTPELESEAKAASDKLDAALAQLPNMPLAEVPDGAGPEDNVEHHRFGAARNYSFPPQQHFELGEALDEMDFATAAKLSGARFVVLKNGLARLERALGQFMLDVHTREHGYTEVAPPLLVREHVPYGTGNLPKSAEDMFCTREGYWLIPTAEVPLTNLVREQILDEGVLPLRFTALTP
jgi:seryl-tRNA synthetase